MAHDILRHAADASCFVYIDDAISGTLQSVVPLGLNTAGRNFNQEKSIISDCINFQLIDK